MLNIYSYSISQYLLALKCLAMLRGTKTQFKYLCLQPPTNTTPYPLLKKLLDLPNLNGCR